MHVSEVRGLSHTCFLDCVVLGSAVKRAAWQSLREWHSQKQVCDIPPRARMPHAPQRCKQLAENLENIALAQMPHAALGASQ